MNKELIDRAWSVLPKKFKEGVKYRYHNFNCYNHTANIEVKEILEYLFSPHNLTSDAEGEVELLHVTRQKVMGLYANAKKIHDLYTSATCINTKESQQIDICKGVMSILDTLFGSKCLPDEEQPKQKDCDNPLADKEGCRWRNDGKCTFDSACYFEPLNPQEPKPAEPKFKYNVGDADIDKIMNAEETVTLKNGTTKTRKAISKTACYKLAGNSIVVSCLYHLFRTMFIPDQPENQISNPIQPSLFD